MPLNTEFVDKTRTRGLTSQNTIATTRPHIVERSRAEVDHGALVGGARSLPVRIIPPLQHQVGGLDVVVGHTSHAMHLRDDHGALPDGSRGKDKG